MDSVDFAAFDFLVGAIVIVGVLGNGNLIAGWMRPIHQFTRYKVCHTAHSQIFFVRPECDKVTLTLREYPPVK